VQAVFVVGYAHVAQPGGGHQPGLPVAQPAFARRFVASARGPGDRGAEHQRNSQERAIHQIHAAVRRHGEGEAGAVAEHDDAVAAPVAFFQRHEPRIGQLLHAARIARARLEIVTFHDAPFLHSEVESFIV